MNKLLLLFITTIPAGICTIILLSIKKEIDRIMHNYNSNYTGLINNFIDLLRIIKLYKNSYTLPKDEKRILGLTLILSLICFVTLISWLVVFLAFPNYIIG